MPSSGSGPGKALINSSAKTGYDNYMAGTTASQYGGTIEKATNSVLDNSTNMFIKQSQQQGDILGTKSPGGSEGGLPASAAGTGSEYGKQLGRGVAELAVNMATNLIKKKQSQGDVLDTQGIQPYDSQSNAQSMNANPMLNNGLGSLGQNNTNDIGISGFGNRFTTQKSNGLGNIVGYNPQGNNYNIIGGVELV